jgi:hypothetical protein
MRENQDTLGIFVNHMISEIKDEDESEEDDFKDQSLLASAATKKVD